MATAAMYLNEDDDVVLDRPVAGDAADEELEEERTSGDRDGAAKAGPRAAEDAPKPTRKCAVRNLKPKLTLELLESDKGLDHIFHTFPDKFRATFKGKGHEVSDLQRLLELYMRWHQRLFPSGTFDDFITNVEKFSSRKDVKANLVHLRQQLLLLLDPEKPEQEAHDQPQAPCPAAAQPLLSKGDTGPQLPAPAAATAPPPAGARPATARAAQWPQHWPEQPQARKPAMEGSSAVATADNVLRASGAPRVGKQELDELDEELLAMQADAPWEAGMDVLDELEDLQQVVPNAAAAARAGDAMEGAPGFAAGLVGAARVAGGPASRAQQQQEDEDLRMLGEFDEQQRLEDSQLCAGDGSVVAPGATGRTKVQRIWGLDLRFTEGTLPPVSHLEEGEGADCAVEQHGAE